MGFEPTTFSLGSWKSPPASRSCFYDAKHGATFCDIPFPSFSSSFPPLYGTVMAEQASRKCDKSCAKKCPKQLGTDVPATNSLSGQQGEILPISVRQGLLALAP